MLQQDIFDDLIVVIPSRMGSVRLENKALAIIDGLTMIERVCLQVRKTHLKNIYVATDSEEIYFATLKAGCMAIMTDSNCSTGTDRVYECYKKIQFELENAEVKNSINYHSGSDQKNKKIKYIINVQGDMPFVDPETILSVARLIKTNKFDIATPVVRTNRENAEGASNVKVVASGLSSINFSENIYIDEKSSSKNHYNQETNIGSNIFLNETQNKSLNNNSAESCNDSNLNQNNNDNQKIEFSSAIYFSRSMIPSNAREFLYHVGIYGFTSDSIEKFCNLEQSYLEKSENLEQLRALENNMSIGICYVKDIPISVDTEEDLEKARKKCRSFPR